MQDKRNTESVVQEIIGLVDDIIGCDSSSYQFDCKREIQSKLRELVEQCSVREPLSDSRINSMDCVYLDFEDDGSCQISSRSVREFARSIERAHNIINTNKG